MAIFSQGDNGNDVEIDEYADAKKLVARAANREALLKGRPSQGGAADDGSGIPVGADFGDMPLKKDHMKRPCWVCPDGSIYLEAFHELYPQAYDFLVAISEPVARPEFIHEYKLTPFSLYAAVATNIDTESIVRVLQSMSKNQLPDSVATFVRECTKRYGKAKLVLKHNKFFVESEHPAVLRELLRDPLIAEARVVDSSLTTKDNADGFVESTKAVEMEENLKILNVDPDAGDSSEEEDEDDSEFYNYLFSNNNNKGGDNDATSGGAAAAAPMSKKKALKQKKKATTTVAFQIKGEAVETVKKQAIDLDYPLMEEYDFRNDKVNPNLPMDLKPHTRIRRYQERSLAKMFGNGRARSGIIVLPCGAGKTLTAVTAAQTVKKSCVCLCTNAVSVLQFKYQFKLWTNIPDDRIALFTSDRKDELHPEACLLITTYTMISYSGRRSEGSAKVMDAIRNREWGLMLMDEVHVVPAKMFRRVVGSVKAHCRLGLTATLVREDDLISDLNFLIGPKLYEANWMDLTAQGYLASVQCVEVWCPMTGPFMKEYLNATKNAKLRQLLYVMNPSKLRTAQFLVNFHEERGDKIILFSDVVFSLKKYADILQRPVIYGETSEKERQAILGTFRASDKLRTICLSKVGDTSIDLPEANVIIQVSSHFGSRRQEAQRLGRILRPKSYTATDGSNKGSFNAFFYTLVSTDTQEMFYSAKRQQYLIDQGYTFKIVTNLSEKADMEAKVNGYEYSTPAKDRDLLRQILNSDLDMEREQRAEDNAIRKTNADGAALADAAHSAKRSAGSAPSLSGASGGVRYKEMTEGGKRHPLFKKRSKR